jgi:[glutamine synthetase] adenylyltransferase / [glutamine synthetase]-adenylyl-L-tyrosine phosphorylase
MADDRTSRIDAFISALPDPQGARAFWERLGAIRKLDYNREPLLASRLLTLAAYSPFLAEDLLRHPENIDWLRRETEGDFERVKTTEQLSDELARFLMRTLDTDERTGLARFKRRELLRTYLRDCLKIATLAEITEELSNLADVILRHGLAVAHQAMANPHGAPLTRDERGRIQTAECAVVALGKLGCHELNYASDIDLLFLFAGDGETAGDGRSPESVIGNKVFFKGVAERVTQMIAGHSAEGAAYRIDLRLRPYGRDGDLVWEIERAAEYYRQKAQNWERQALLRARASAGSEVLVGRFLDLVRDTVFTLAPQDYTTQDVRRAKEKIDREVARRGGGFNVKLGRGGVREIEFIAQALQLRHGGREPWLRSMQTLIVLARLAEKNYLSKAESARLSAAYTFLRTVEHRLQMEHGAQTHTLPVARERLALVARRCGYLQSSDPAADLLRDLEAHTAAVRAIYHRVFADGGSAASIVAKTTEPATAREMDDETARLVRQAVAAMAKAAGSHASGRADDSTDAANRSARGADESTIHDAIVAALASAINPLRSLRNLAAWGESCATLMRDRAAASRVAFDFDSLIERLLPTLSSQYLANLLIARPMLADALDASTPREATVFYQLMHQAIADESSPSAKSAALRRAWHRQVTAIGYADVLGVGGRRPCAGEQSNTGSQLSGNDLLPAPDLRVNNLTQTALAEATLRLAVEIALEALGINASPPSVGQANGTLNSEPSPAPGPRPPALALPFAILGLGRLGHAGMDYGSDMDLLVVFDDAAEWPPAALAATGALKQEELPHEFYARFTSELVRVLASITREGLLYRVDLRLRPEGKNGPLAQGMNGLVTYLTNRASAWEHSAYLKAREVAGDLSFGERARQAICEACFETAASNANLRGELAGMRERIEADKVRGAQVNVKWGRGGMTDVYFVTRYLQLSRRIYYPPAAGTAALINHLGERGALDAESTRALFAGYTFLRRLDHWMRLLLDRPTPVMPVSQVALNDLARALGINSLEELEQQLTDHLAAIRAAYDRVFLRRIVDVGDRHARHAAVVDGTVAQHARRTFDRVTDDRREV